MEDYMLEINVLNDICGIKIECPGLMKEVSVFNKWL